jgi:DNA-binding NarL/FixJ family response regulator
VHREVEVLRHLVDGNRNRDIAEKLYIAEETVKAHIKHIMHKLGANDRTHALAIAFRRGLAAYSKFLPKKCDSRGET